LQLCAILRWPQYYVEQHNIISPKKLNNFSSYIHPGPNPLPRVHVVVSLQVIINVKDDQTPGPTVINVKDGQTTSPTLLPRIETTVATVQVSIVPLSVGHSCSCRSVYRFRHSDIVWLSLLAICTAITFCIYKVYFISDRHHSVMY